MQHEELNLRQRRMDSIYKPVQEGPLPEENAVQEPISRAAADDIASNASGLLDAIFPNGWKVMGVNGHPVEE